jgi:hypothetical protein
MKIASMEDPFPRGTVIGRQITGSPLSEAEHFRKCQLCGGYVDTRVLIVARFRAGKGPTLGAYWRDGTGTLHRETHPTLACRADW